MSSPGYNVPILHGLGSPTFLPPPHRLGYVRDLDLVLKPLNSTLFPGLGEPILVHHGFQVAHQGCVRSRPLIRVRGMLTTGKVRLLMSCQLSETPHPHTTPARSRLSANHLVSVHINSPTIMRMLLCTQHCHQVGQSRSWRRYSSSSTSRMPLFMRSGTGYRGCVR